MKARLTLAALMALLLFGCSQDPERNGSTNESTTIGNVDVAYASWCKPQQFLDGHELLQANFAAFHGKWAEGAESRQGIAVSIRMSLLPLDGSGDGWQSLHFSSVQNNKAWQSRQLAVRNKTITISGQGHTAENRRRLASFPRIS